MLEENLQYQKNDPNGNSKYPKPKVDLPQYMAQNGGLNDSDLVQTVAATLGDNLPEKLNLEKCNTNTLLAIRAQLEYQRLVTSVAIMVEPQTEAYQILTTDYLDMQNRPQALELIKEITSTLEKEAQTGISRELKRFGRTMNEFVIGHGGVIFSIAKKYRHGGLPLKDLIQEGNLGLLRALDKFKLSYDNQFYSYAKYQIKKAIIRAIHNQARTIRNPVHIEEELFKITQEADHLRMKSGREPTIKEIADRLNIPPETLVRRQQQSRITFSLEEPVGRNNKKIFDFLSDKNSNSPDMAYERHELRTIINDTVGTLTIREVTIIFMYDLLEYGSFRTIGSELSLTGEWTRKNRLTALEKLRHPKTGLEEFL